jgi:hypothetical protein
MARHKSSHVQVAYPPDTDAANVVWHWRRRRPCSVRWGWNVSFVRLKAGCGQNLPALQSITRAAQ